MAAQREGRLQDVRGATTDPPPPPAPHTWKAVEQARAERRRSQAARDRTAAGKSDRDRAAERARAVAAQRRAALIDRAFRSADRWEAPALSKVHAPVARAPELAPEPAAEPAAENGPSPRTRTWMAAGVAAGLAVATGMCVGVVAVVDNLDDGSLAAGAAAAGPPAPTVAAPPPAAREAGEYVRSRVDPSGRLLTQHWIVRDEPITALTVRPQPDNDLAAVTPVLERLTVVADGRLMPGAARQLSDSGSGTVSLEPDTRTVRLRYVTRSVVRQTGATSPNRALVLVNPLRLQAGTATDIATSTDPRVVRLTGDDVLSLACVSASGVPQPCGRPYQDGWRVELEAAQAVTVVAQVDLPGG